MANLRHLRECAVSVETKAAEAKTKADRFRTALTCYPHARATAFDLILSKLGAERIIAESQNGNIGKPEEFRSDLVPLGRIEKDPQTSGTSRTHLFGVAYTTRIGWGGASPETEQSILDNLRSDADYFRDFMLKAVERFGVRYYAGTSDGSDLLQIEDEWVSRYIFWGTKVDGTESDDELARLYDERGISVESLIGLDATLTQLAQAASQD